MSFNFDSTGVDPDGTPGLLPPGWYPFKIFEAEEMTSSKGNFMVLVKCQVAGDPRYENSSVWHYVTFIPKGQPGDGINVQFRKCIGVPFGGKDRVDASEWVGKRFMGKIKHETYEGKKKNAIKEVSPMRENAAPATVVANKDEDIPF